jgi:hypothetical protein
MPSVKLPVAVTCQCAISYHVEVLPSGNRRFVLDEELPSVLFMCVGRCEKCGLPFHNEFPVD